MHLNKTLRSIKGRIQLILYGRCGIHLVNLKAALKNSGVSKKGAQNIPLLSLILEMV